MNEPNMITVLLLLVLLLAVLGTRWYQFLPLGEVLEAIRQFKCGLLGYKSVYSAETIKSREAEFVRDQLPKRYKGVWLVTVIGLCGALIWLLLR